MNRMERPLTQHFRPDGKPLTLDEYRAAGGYRAVETAVRSKTPQDVQQIVKASGLRGRGGAGFPTGLKWSFVPMGPGANRPKYLVANADELEPGAIKDRFLMEHSPHQLIEGMILAAFAIEAQTGYIFIRYDYHDAASFLHEAIVEARKAGLLGQKILGTDVSIDLHVHSSAGRYICGEETALINALEGRRANPRSKPPFPQISGLFGKPTIVQNVETLCNLPHIVANGPEWFKSLSRSKDAGTKVYGVSGRVKRPGIWELPMGTTLRELIFDHAGGMLDGYQLKGIIPGGASTDFLLPGHLDLAMDFDTIQGAGSRMGTGTLIILDDRTCPVAMLVSLERFFAQESCGWCTPCRDGLSWIEKTLVAIEQGEGQPGDIDVLEHHCRMLGAGNTFCALAPGAIEPLQSALKYFRTDIEAHIEKRACPYGNH